MRAMTHGKSPATYYSKRWVQTTGNKIKCTVRVHDDANTSLSDCFRASHDSFTGSPAGPAKTGMGLVSSETAIPESSVGVEAPLSS